MIQVRCNKCGCELFTPGALLFSPPSPEGFVMKIHLCEPCFGMVMQVLGLFNIGVNNAV